MLTSKNVNTDKQIDVIMIAIKGLNARCLKSFKETLRPNATIAISKQIVVRKLTTFMISVGIFI